MVEKEMLLLIARTSENVIGFARYDSECFESWLEFLKKFKPPKYVVCDGQNGLLKAINKVWSKTLVQQCNSISLRMVDKNLQNIQKLFKANS